MKKRKNIVLGLLVLLVLIAVLASCASIRTRESAGEDADDAAITSRVKSLFAADDFLKSFQISVVTYRGAVHLSGFVNSHKAVTKAVEIVKGVNGVTSIKPRLIIK